MAERWNLKRFTRADALVVGVICLLLVVLVPVLLAKPREQSIRQLCAANLAQIGKTMLAYANDYQGALPRAAATWGAVPNWEAPNRYMAFSLDVKGQGGTATISSCFFLLVKYYEVPTKLFICRGDRGTTEFILSGWGKSIPTNFKLADAWDFGPRTESFKHCSYSYHIPFGRYPLTTSRDPNLAVAADRNPFFKSPMANPVPLVLFQPDLPTFPGTAEQARTGNAIAHGRDGQNVLFLDGRVSFEERAYCAVDNDNIYLISIFPNRGSPVGEVAFFPGVTPSNDRDSFLVHDPDTWPAAKPQQP